MRSQGPERAAGHSAARKTWDRRSVKGRSGVDTTHLLISLDSRTGPNASVPSAPLVDTHKVQRVEGCRTPEGQLTPW